MSEKRDDLGDDISRLLDEGDGLLNEDELEEALSRFQAAWDLLPEPREEYPLALNILAAIAEAHFFQREFDRAKAVLMKSTTCSYGEPVANAYIRLRLGQCLFELAHTGLPARRQGPLRAGRPQIPGVHQVAVAPAPGRVARGMVEPDRSGRIRS
jgi:tetratricopeptide (TPR) repeat protein